MIQVRNLVHFNLSKHSFSNATLYHLSLVSDSFSTHMIPATFNEETELLNDNNLNSLKRHHMTFHRKL
jgi:hypothetical protein